MHFGILVIQSSILCQVPWVVWHISLNSAAYNLWSSLLLDMNCSTACLINVWSSGCHCINVCFCVFCMLSFSWNIVELESGADLQMHEPRWVSIYNTICYVKHLVMYFSLHPCKAGKSPRIGCWYRTFKYLTELLFLFFTSCVIRMHALISFGKFLYAP